MAANEQQPFQPPLPPGINPPLPVGQLIPGGERGAETPLRDLTANPAVQNAQPLGIDAVSTAGKLTPAERTALEKLGWKDGEPIPVDMAKLLQSPSGEPVSDIQLPASSPDAEKVPMSADEIARGEGILANAQAALSRAQAMGGSQIDESVQRAMDAATGAGPPDVAIVDDTEESVYDSGQPKSETGAEPALAKCPHCEWDLRLRDPIRVTDDDKRRFLQSLLGQVPFQKSFRILGGAMTVVYRSLSPRELDTCFEQAYLERKQGKFQSADAYFEIINRFRLALQLVRIESQEVNHTFPMTVEGWEKRLAADEKETTDLPVRRISEFMFTEVVRTESFNRILGGLAGEFNSLVGKLEANTHNSDFWSVTKTPT